MGVPGRGGGVQGGRGEGAAGDAGKGCVILRAWQSEPRSGGQRSRMARGSERSSGRRGRARERRPELEERTGGGRRARSITYLRARGDTAPPRARPAGDLPAHCLVGQLAHAQEVPGSSHLQHRDHSRVGVQPESHLQARPEVRGALAGS